MKKLVLAIVIAFISVNLNAQSKLNKRAVEITNEMTEFLSLTDAQSAQVLEIKTAQYKKKRKLDKSNPDDKELMKKEMRIFQNQIKDVIGKKKLKAWYRINSKKK